MCSGPPPPPLEKIAATIKSVETTLRFAVAEAAKDKKGPKVAESKAAETNRRVNEEVQACVAEHVDRVEMSAIVRWLCRLRKKGEKRAKGELSRGSNGEDDVGTRFGPPMDTKTFLALVESLKKGTCRRRRGVTRTHAHPR